MPIAAITSTDFKPKAEKDIERILNRKIPLGSDAFDTLKAESRARAFRIAGVNKASLIERAQREIAQAMRDRVPFRDLRAKLLALFEDAGIDAPALNHLRTIIRQNQNTVDSVARSRVLKLPSVKRQFPYWQYVSVKDAGVRPTHAALNGLVFRQDDPFWDSYDPPWEWGCRCAKIPISRGQLKRMGLEVKTRADVAKEGITPNPEFDFPRDQLAVVDRVALRQYTGDLRKLLDERFREADRIEDQDFRNR